MLGHRLRPILPQRHGYLDLFLNYFSTNMRLESTPIIETVRAKPKVSRKNNDSSSKQNHFASKHCSSPKHDDFLSEYCLF